MGTYKQCYYGDVGWYDSTDIGDAPIGKAFFDSLNCPLIETELINNYTFTINIDNTILLTLDDSTSVARVTSTYDGVTTEIGYIQAAGNKVFTVTCSDTFLYIYFVDYFPRPWYLCYEKIGDDKYYGTRRDDSGLTLSDITLTKLGTNETFIHGKLLNYTVDVDCIDYLDNDILFSNGVKTLPDPNCIAISNSPVNSVITFNGYNYYTLSSNTAIQID
jgi:hypothetical protein